MISLADTGLLVAFLYPRDEFHLWAVSEFKQARAPFVSCEAVLTETAYLVSERGVPRERVARLVSSGAVRIAFDLQREAETVETLLRRYADTPMDWADACLVRMAELDSNTEVVTLDSDFHIYRRNRSEVIPLRMPPERARS